MAVNSTGEQNRISGRDFNENNIQIDKFDGRHTINIAIPSEKHDERPLVKAQRKELNALVATVSATCGGEVYEIWQKVHAEIGVSSIEEMTVNQYQTAISFLQAMIGRGKDKDASKALVSLLLRNSEDSELRQRLIRYCHVNFGTGRLNDLTRAQLQMTLSWLDQQTQINPSPQRDPMSPQFNFTTLLKSYPKELITVFVVGFLLGALIF
ncbi:membrane protein [Raoultella planticola]|uniref:membrane protein n=1 Tax=Raoultella planticola TaxID=575 RepID=UPI00062BA757|nr:membrane protein [Raoultella planticola]